MKRLILCTCLILMLIGCKNQTDDSGLGRTYTGIEYKADEAPLEDSVKKYKEIFDIDEEFDSLTTDEHHKLGNKIYNLSMVNTEDGHHSVDLTIDDRGQLLSYTKFDGTASSEKDKVEPEELQSIARDLLIELYGDVANDFLIQEDPDGYEDTGVVVFTRTVNQIPVLGDQVSVYFEDQGAISGVEVKTTTNYDFSSSDHFEDPKEIQDMDSAYSAFVDNNEIYQGIMDTNKHSDKKSPNYIYAARLFAPLVFIDAQTLEPEEITIDTDYFWNYGLETDYSDDKIYEEKPEQVIQDQKSLEDVEKRARKLLSIPGEYRLKYSNHLVGEDQEETWQLEFIKKDTEYIGLVLKGEELDLINYYKELDTSTKGGKKDLTKAKDIGQKFIIDKGQINSDEIQLVNINYEDLNYGYNGDMAPQYNLRYIRKVDDQYILSDSINIEIDGRDFSVISYDKNWDSDLKLEERSLDPIPEEDIYKVLNDSHTFGPMYVWSGSPEDEVKIYYNFLPKSYRDSYIVDLDTMELINESGIPVDLKMISTYQDIKEADNPELVEKILADGIFYPEEYMRPKDPINQLDFARLLLEDTTQSQAHMAFDEDDIKNFAYFIEDEEWNPTKEITQRDAAKFLVRKANLEDIAKYNDILKTGYKDMDNTDPDYGYLLVAKNKGFIKTEFENTLEPNKILDREEALIYYYNYKQTK